MLNYLNGYFSWGVDWMQLEEKFDKSRLDAVLPFLDVEEKYKAPREAQPHIYSRILSRISTLMAIVAGYLHLNLFIVTAVLAIPDTFNRIYQRKWQTENYGRAIGGEDENIEKNKYTLFPILYISMWFVVLIYYGVGWIIDYLINYIFR